MCQGVTKSGSPTPREMTSAWDWTMSKNSRMPERGICRTCSGINLVSSRAAAISLGNGKTAEVQGKREGRPCDSVELALLSNELETAWRTAPQVGPKRAGA